jgi:lysozyme
MDRTLSDKGAEFIAGFEGFSARLYEDPAGHCSIGFGHQVHPGKCDGSEPKEFKDGISRKRGLRILQKDAGIAGDEVNRSVEVRLNQTQFDALVSFTFNVGTGAFRDSTLLRLLNKGRYRDVPEQLDRWVFAGGEKLESLINRRKAEGRLFREGKY